MKLKINSIELRKDTYGTRPSAFKGTMILRTDDYSVNHEISLTNSTIESVLDIVEPLVQAEIVSKFGEYSTVHFEPCLRLGMKETDAEVIEV